ncbi:MAG: FHA domain-containing protein [Dehalococcoidia bacterium]
MAWLVDSEQQHELTYILPEDKPFRIGRGRGNDLTFRDGRVSRAHAKIVWDHQGFLLRDNDSANGTFVNGRRIGAQPHRLEDNDEITLGRPPCATLVFRTQEETIRQPESSETPLLAGLEVDVMRQVVKVDGRVLEQRLPTREFHILGYIWAQGTRPSPMTELKKAGWPDLSEEELETVSNETIHTYIYRIRKYLRDNGADSIIIENVRRVGYRLVPPADPDN